MLSKESLIGTESVLGPGAWPWKSSHKSPKPDSCAGRVEVPSHSRGTDLKP